jgi:hypothetical protein
MGPQPTAGIGSSWVCVARLALVGLLAGLSCHPASVSDAGAAKRRRAPAPADPADTIEGCRTRPSETGLLIACVTDRFALDLPGLSEGFVWSFRRPPDPSQTHVIFVAEDSRNNADLYSLSVLVGPDEDEQRNISTQLSELYERLRKDTREAGRSDPRRGRDLSPPRPCQTKADQQPCLSYEVRGMSIDGKSIASTHAWSAARREDGSVLFFHAAWAGYAVSSRADQPRQLAKANKQMRALLDAAYVIDAEGRRMAH